MGRLAEFIASHNWNKGRIALDAKNCGLPKGDDPRAVSWCLLGAIDACYPFSQRRNIYTTLQYNLADRGHDPSITAFNDHPDRTKEQVIELCEQIPY